MTTLRSNPFRIWTLLVGALLSLGVLGCGGTSGTSATTHAAAQQSSAAKATSQIRTVTPGVITVAIYSGGLPYVDSLNGKCVGLDCDILFGIAKNLGYKVHVEVMSFPAELAAIESHRVDMGMGDVSWTAKRAQVGIFTDPTYYTSAAVLQSVGGHVDTIPELAGKTVGTVTGYNWVQALEQVPGVHVQTYNTPDAVYADISNGRLALGFVDAITDQYNLRVHPNLHYASVPLIVTPAELKKNPAYVTFAQNQGAFFLNKQEVGLEHALNTQIDAMWHAGTIVKYFKAFGISNYKPFLTPQPISFARRGVDRPSNWQAPSIGYTPAG